jgi:hypothetical protein
VGCAEIARARVREMRVMAVSCRRVRRYVLAFYGAAHVRGNETRAFRRRARAACRFRAKRGRRKGAIRSRPRS